MRTKARHGLRKQSPAAAGIERHQSRKRMHFLAAAAKMRADLIADIAHPHGVHPVQGLELAVLVPPLRSDTRKTLDFTRIDGHGLCYTYHNEWHCKGLRCDNQG